MHLLNQVLERVGFDKLASFFDTHKPLPVQGRLVSEGEPSHRHKLVVVPWDTERFGPDVTDLDPDRPMAMATYHDLWACSCGREAISSQRTFI